MLTNDLFKKKIQIFATCCFDCFMWCCCGLFSSFLIRSQPEYWTHKNGIVYIYRNCDCLARHQHTNRLLLRKTIRQMWRCVFLILLRINSIWTRLATSNIIKIKAKNCMQHFVIDAAVVAIAPSQFCCIFVKSRLTTEFFSEIYDFNGKDNKNCSFEFLVLCVSKSRKTLIWFGFAEAKTKRFSFIKCSIKHLFCRLWYLLQYMKIYAPDNVHF